MSSVKFFPIMVVVFIVIVIFSGLNLVGQEISGNSNLDDASVTLITNLGNDIDTNYGDLTLTTSNLTNGSIGNEGQDPFALQFLETKQQANQFLDIVNSVITLPDLFLLGIGIDEENILVYKLLLGAFIIMLIAVATFVAFFGEGRIT